ncbi:mitochondrial carrier domain-containing protein [Halteromyces radiatus]|uniref:mitochondrial carrier domain-containing protein n=1 Tax=Halteromyces radiatus TaxID=101107 RepID=UPI00221FDF2C|nr:mitochondrial carrier domain-containing protein [Halteromyces radiatus]KAI8086239.1 mitochondrial carrier domain-containing protein [Halteromyces radiatus]
MTDGYTLFASSIAALTARICTHPIDTIKTRLQATHQPKLQGQSYVQWMIRIINQGSISSSKWRVARQLYSGLPVTLIFSVPALSVYLSCYESSKQYLDYNGIARHDHLGNHMISGAMAEIMAGTLFTPMEVLKNQLQTSTLTARQLTQRIYQQEGLGGFFRGYWMGLIVFLPHTMIYFATYEHLKSKMIKDGNNNNNKWTYYLFASSMASFISSGMSAPLDIIKTRWQVSASDQGKQYRKGPWHIAKHLWLYEGQWKGLAKGLGARVIWAIPTTAISMTVFETVKDYRYLFF